MAYRLGVDLGTTYSSAAAARDGRVRIVNLGSRSAVIPSAVLARDDGEILVGEAADRRGMAEPGNVAREFKRRIGDSTPIRLGDTSMRPEQLMAALVPAIIQAATEREGGPPDEVIVTHPANWGPTKRALLTDAIAAVGVDVAATITEPEAAAIYYATTERIDPGQVVAVYDLGGGTFDVALLRRTEDAFEIIGKPEGIDRLGGVDFDAAVLAHVNRFLDGTLDLVDLSDPAAAHALSRLRADCVEAKEALSSDTDVSIPVLLPGLRTEVRMTRAELEAMIRPAIGDTIGALRRAMRAAKITPAEVSVVLLVGGSSRIPLVAQLVGAQVGRPVAVDVHPKHAVALGAALHRVATGATPPVLEDAAGPASVTPAAPVTPAGPAAPVASAVSAAPPAGAAAAAPPAGAAAAAPTAPPDRPPTEPAAPAPTAPAAPAPAASAPAAPAAAPSGPGARPPTRSPTATPFAPETASGPRRGVLIGALVAAVVAVAVVVVVLASGGGGGGGTDLAGGGTDTVTEPTTASTDATTPSSETTVSDTTASTAATTAATPTTAPPEATTIPAVCDNPPTQPFVCAESVSVDAAGNLLVPFRAIGFSPFIGAAPNQHVHFYFPVLEIAANPLNAGATGPNQQGRWVLWDQPSTFGPGGKIASYTVEDAKAVGAKEICVVVANSGHDVLPGTGNCLPLPAAAL